MDRSAWPEPSTAGASLPGCLYADAVMSASLLPERKVVAEVAPPSAISYFVAHFLLKALSFLAPLLFISTLPAETRPYSHLYLGVCMRARIISLCAVITKHKGRSQLGSSLFFPSALHYMFTSCWCRSFLEGENYLYFWKMVFYLTFAKSPVEVFIVGPTYWSWSC